MRNKFWLIQRGFFNPNISESTNLMGSAQSGALLEFDYMGSAEFEFGAIPRAYIRIMGQFEKYSLHATDLVTIQGLPFYLYCRDDRYDEILKEIKILLEDDTYQLKEWSDMDIHFKNTSEKILAYKPNFWWCIDKADADDSRKDCILYNPIGDWIAFVGTADRQDAFERVIQSDYTNWWSKKSLKDREKEFKDSFKC